MEPYHLILRTFLIYFFVLLAMRLMGKREVGRLSLFDLVISVMIAEIAVFVLEDVKKPLLDGLIPMAVLVGIQIAIAWLSLKVRAIRLLFDGKPSVIVKDGKLNREEMRRQKYNLDDLLTQLRERNITRLSDVEFAVLETSGKLSAKEKDPAAAEKGTNIRYEGLPVPLIMDGKVQDDNLRKIGKTRFWLKRELEARGIRHFKDVFLCTCNHKGELYIDKR